MHAAEVLALRTQPAAGIFFSLTRRCPLHCAHCSTRSTPDAEQHPAEPFLRLARSFTAECRPEVVSLTGGEPLLRPRLVRDLAEMCHDAGARVDLLTGGFFLRGNEVPRRIGEAVRELDHLAVSVDRFHEPEVPRRAVLAFLAGLVDAGMDVSVQLTGESEDDPYLAEAIEDIRTRLGDRVPMFVGLLGPGGRAADWLPPRSSPESPPVAYGCDAASWPVVGFDGRVVACCNQDAVDGPTPRHLLLGHAAQDGWPVLRGRALRRATLRAIRTYGPRWLGEQNGHGCSAGVCESCHLLGTTADLDARMRTLMESPAGRLAESVAAGGPASPRAAVASAAAMGIPAFAGLGLLGLEQAAAP
jgi:pyruvate-formate lyase-activating enzyme